MQQKRQKLVFKANSTDTEQMAPPGIISLGLYCLQTMTEIRIRVKLTIWYTQKKTFTSTFYSGGLLEHKVHFSNALVFNFS